MTTWSNDELDRIGSAEEVRIQTLRKDGTLRNPVIVWIVRHGDSIFIRSVNGSDAAWFRGTQSRHEGRILIDGYERDVRFVEEADPAINNAIDEEYRTKYRRYPGIVPGMVTPEVRATTIRLVPSNIKP